MGLNSSTGATILLCLFYWVNWDNFLEELVPYKVRLGNAVFGLRAFLSVLLLTGVNCYEVKYGGFGDFDVFWYWLASVFLIIGFE